MGLQIHAATSQADLFSKLAESLATSPSSPLEMETILVQSQGLRRFLTLRLADALPCVGSTRMPFPGTFCRELTSHLFGNLPAEDDPFARENMHWRLYSLLGQEALLHTPAARPLASYLRDNDPQLRWQLAGRLANLFDNYMLYRPDLLDNWALPGKQASEHLAWQKMVWDSLLNLAGNIPPLHKRYRAVQEAIRAGTLQIPGLPAQVHVFGINTLAPAFLNILLSLQSHCEVIFYLLLPTCDAEITDEPAANPLVDSLGTQSRTLLRQIRTAAPKIHIQTLTNTTTDALPDKIEGKPANTPAETLLLHLQQDIRENKCRPLAQAEKTPDLSLRIHDCHSPMREMEILRDQLLDAFATMPELKPEEVAVLVPSIDDYAPYIDAVFGVPMEGLPQIPYRKADCNLLSQDATIQAFLHLLTLPDSRMTPGDVLPLLEAGAIRRMAGIHEDDLPRIRALIEQAHIYWGIDESARTQIRELPAGSPVQSYKRINTWRQGLEAMLLSYMVGTSAGAHGIVGDLAPEAFSHIADRRLLGKTCHFLETLFGAVAEWGKPHTLEEWLKKLDFAAQLFFRAQERDEHTGISLIKQTLNAERGRLHLLPELADELLPLGIVRKLLEQALGNDGFGTPFFTGSVMFCSIKPMRSIPFRVLAVCGLQNGVFPRRDTPPAFDLGPLTPTDGDRSVREDDRQTFLELLLAAKDRLLLTYVGHNQKDNTEVAPSTCLSELQDYLRHALGKENTKSIVVQHRLQPFSPAYYETQKDPAYFSYIREYCPVPAQEESAPSLLNASLPCDQTEVTLDELVRALVNAPRFYCNHALQIYFDEYATPADGANRYTSRMGDTDAAQTAHEPLHASPLQQSQLRQALLEAFETPSQPATRDGVYRYFALRGELPPAGYGHAAFVKLYDEVQAFHNALPSADPHESVAVDLSIGSWRVTGLLDHLTQAGRVQYRCANLKPKDWMRAWIHHLALNCLTSQNILHLPPASSLYGLDGQHTFSAVTSSADILGHLLELYGNILRAPQPLFENAAFAFAKTADKTKAYNAAQRKWVEKDSANPYTLRCFGDDIHLDALRTEFERCARTAWEECFRHAAPMEENA